MTYRILVVDDELDVEMLFQQGLRNEIRNGELKMEFAPSGAAALARIRQADGRPIDMIISDLNMPGIGGLELVQTVHEEVPEMQFAVVTAYADPVTSQKAASAGAAYFFPKPVDFDAIRSCLAPLQS